MLLDGRFYTNHLRWRLIVAVLGVVTCGCFVQFPRLLWGLARLMEYHADCTMWMKGGRG